MSQVLINAVKITSIIINVNSTVPTPHLEHLCSLLPPLSYLRTLREQVLDVVLSVEVFHELTLEVVLHVVHEEVHYCLRDLILDTLTDDVEI